MSAAPLCLQLDVGNSSAKWRLVGKEVLARGRYRSGDAVSRQALLAIEAPARIWVASVASTESEAALRSLLEVTWGLTPWFARTPASAGELINSYEEPARMGVDRWLAMLAGRALRHGCYAVVDAGSALTIDIVAADGMHQGGYIIPGAELMERSLLLDTDRVRFDEEVDYALGPGSSTAEAVRHGIAAAQCGAVTTVLERAGVGPGQTLFCGGGASILMELMGRSEGYEPDLVFQGLELQAGQQSLAG